MLPWERNQQPAGERAIKLAVLERGAQYLLFYYSYSVQERAPRSVLWSALIYLVYHCAPQNRLVSQLFTGWITLTAIQWIVNYY